MSEATMWVIPLGPGGRGAVGAALGISLLSLALSLVSLLRPRRSSGTDAGPPSQERSPADVLAIRLAVFLAVLVSFVVTQPLLWRAGFGEDPPGSATDLGTIVGVVLTIASLAAGALGTILYRTIESRMKDISEEAKQQVGERLTAIDVAQRGNLGYLSWMNYEQTWREEGYSDAAAARPAFKAFLEAAITMTEESLTLCSHLPPEKRSILEPLARRNLAYHLATRGRRQDAQRAVDLLSQLDDEDTISYEEIDTHCWVYHRLTDDEKRKALFKEKLRTALGGDIPEDDRKAVLERYAGALGIDDLVES